MCVRCLLLLYLVVQAENRRRYEAHHARRQATGMAARKNVVDPPVRQSLLLRMLPALIRPFRPFFFYDHSVVVYIFFTTTDCVIV